MSQNLTEFNRGVIQPVKCLKEAWELIKGQYWLFFGICVVGMLIGSAFAIVLMGPMMCGMFYCVFQRLRGEPVKFEGLFRGFDYFGQALIAMLIQAIPAVIIIVPTYLIMMGAMIAIGASARGGGGEDMAVAGFVIAMVVVFVVILVMSIVLGIFFMFTFPLVVDRRLSGVDAVKTSVKAAKANFGGVCGLVFLHAVLSFAGLLLCYVGAFLVMPITITAQAIAYRRVFPEIPHGLSTPPPPATWAA